MASRDLDRTEWVKAKPVFTPGNLRIKSLPVMEDWETDYMQKLASITASAGRSVLEIGFGLGISAGFIQTAPQVKKHVIIEPHPVVIEFARQKFPVALQSKRMEIVQGFWEDAVKGLESESFDGILFDTTPISSDIGNLFYEWEFFEEAYRLLKTGGVFTYFCIDIENDALPQTHIELLRKAGFARIDYEVVAVNPPPDCEYWSHNCMIAPIAYK